MKVDATPLAGVFLLHPPVFRDERGYFVESWNAKRYAEFGIRTRFVQDNVSVSRRGVIRGLHYQNPSPQAKLVSVLEGEVWDVAIDIRNGSETFGHWLGVTISADSGTQILIPEGFAHGFAVLSDSAIVSYKCGDYYNPAAERTIRWDDPDLAIDWPVGDPILSPKDRAGRSFRELAEAGN